MKTKVIAVINQKGGVGKTTTVANLGYTLAQQGKDVLLIDFDSQASLTNYLNVGLTDNNYYGIYEMMLSQMRRISADEDPYLCNLTFDEMCEQFIIKPTFANIVVKNIGGTRQVIEEQEEFGVSLLPACIMLSDYELELGKSSKYNAFNLSVVIGRILAWHEYDYVFIDCNPSLGVLTMNAITAATDGILIPTNMDVMSIRGVSNLINRVIDIQETLASLNPPRYHMGVIGIVLNLYADRRTVDQTIRDDIERFYPYKIFDSQIPESVNAKKAALTGVTYAQMYKKAKDAYSALADELEKKLEEMEKEGPQIIHLRDEPEERRPYEEYMGEMKNGD